MSEITKFKDGLKECLRASNTGKWIDSNFYDYGGQTGAGCNPEVNWEELDKAIDDFAATFQKQKVSK